MDRPEPRLRLAPDCPPMFGEPWMVISVFIVGMMIFSWGLYAAYGYWKSPHKDMGMIWWQMAVSMMMISLMGMVLPSRVRFSPTLYGLLSVLLIAQYALFVLMFPFILPSSSDLAAIQRVVKQQKTVQV
jgi:hypothetical protein